MMNRFVLTCPIGKQQADNDAAEPKDELPGMHHETRAPKRWVADSVFVSRYQLVGNVLLLSSAA